MKRAGGTLNAQRRTREEENSTRNAERGKQKAERRKQLAEEVASIEKLNFAYNTNNMKFLNSCFPIVKSAFSLLFGLAFFICACNEKPKVEMREAPAAHTDSTHAKFTAAMVDNKKDPSCGMPVTAGIMDTLHYNGKVYGFCSDECRDAFLKDPAALAKVAEMK